MFGVMSRNEVRMPLQRTVATLVNLYRIYIAHIISRTTPPPPTHANTTHLLAIACPPYPQFPFCIVIMIMTSDM